jgi:hypothetical protein
MQRARAIVGALVASAVLSFAGLAYAQRVVLVRPAAGDEVLSEAFNRLRAELVLQGFETSVVEPPGQLSAEGLDALASAEHAFAAIALSRASESSSARIVIADRVTGKTSLRTLSLRDTPEAPKVLAVRASDFLRASLREYSEGSAPPPEVTGVDRNPRSEALERWAKEPPGRFRLDAAAAVIGATEPDVRAWGPSFALEYRPFERAGFGAVVQGPTLAGSYETANGSAVVHHLLLLGRFSFTFFEDQSLSLRSLALAGAYRIEARGTVEPPLVPQSAASWSFAGGAELEASYRLTSAVVVAAGFSALFLSPRPVIAVLDAETEMSLPFTTARLGCGVEF